MKLVRKNYETQAERRKDFAVGIGVLVALNGLIFLGMYLLVYLASVEGNEALAQFAFPLSNLMGFAPFLLNIGLAVYFALTRYWIALGMVAAYAALMLLGLVIGAIAAIACFASL